MNVPSSRVIISVCTSMYIALLISYKVVSVTTFLPLVQGYGVLIPPTNRLLAPCFFFSAFIVCTTPDLFKLLNNLTDGYLKPFGQIEPDCKKLLPTLKTTEN